VAVSLLVIVFRDGARDAAFAQVGAEASGAVGLIGAWVGRWASPGGGRARRLDCKQHRECFDKRDAVPASAAIELAEEHPVSVGLTKAYEKEREAFLWMSGQPDAAEGVAAFLQKRPGCWGASKNGAYPTVRGV
jgi:enoyl-CoA hydratase/carnithine racemase